MSNFMKKSLLSVIIVFGCQSAFAIFGGGGGGLTNACSNCPVSTNAAIKINIVRAITDPETGEVVNAEEVVSAKWGFLSDNAVPNIPSGTQAGGLPTMAKSGIKYEIVFNEVPGYKKHKNVIINLKKSKIYERTIFLKPLE